MDDITIMMIDEDLVMARQIWNQFGNDEKRMSGLFDMLITRYKDIIDGISDGLEVISMFDSEASKRETYKNNVHKVIVKIENFKNCGYSNVELAKHYLTEGVNGEIYNLTFNETRDIILNLEEISQKERDEIIMKIDEIESIVSSLETKKSKWYALRPYIVWASGKEVNIAMLIIPLIMKIN